VVQQYLVREDGAWRVATGDNATINTFLKANPGFGKKFPIKKPQAFINQNRKVDPGAAGKTVNRPYRFRRIRQAEEAARDRRQPPSGRPICSLLVFLICVICGC
jgi:hypothetical protein